MDAPSLDCAHSERKQESKADKASPLTQILLNPTRCLFERKCFFSVSLFTSRPCVLGAPNQRSKDEMFK